MKVKVCGAGAIDPNSRLGKLKKVLPCLFSQETEDAAAAEGNMTFGDAPTPAPPVPVRERRTLFTACGEVAWSCVSSLASSFFDHDCFKKRRNLIEDQPPQDPAPEQLAEPAAEKPAPGSGKKKKKVKKPKRKAPRF